MARAPSRDVVASKGKAGGKLNRSETVTVRLDPRLNYLCDLAARVQRRTKSSFIEWAVETVLDSVKVPNTGGWDSEALSINDLAKSLWDVDEMDRLVALAFHAPILMTHEEQVIWKLIRDHGYMWRGRWYGATGDDEETWTWQVLPEFLIEDRLRKYFPVFKSIAAGLADDDDPSDNPIPSWQRTRKIKATSGANSDLDDDIPF